MNHVYEVKFETRYTGWGWLEDSARVLANGSATKAVEMVRRHEMKESFEDFTKGHKRVIRRAIGFRMTGVQQLTHVDY